MKVTLTDEAEPKKRRSRKSDIAEFYNREVLPKKRADFSSEFGAPPDPEEFFEVKGGNLVLSRAWDCQISPTKFCVYEADSGENCIFCGEPEERL